MKIKSVKVHNFRSIKDNIFNMYDYSLLIGENNSGKTNIMTALRVFYEDNIKFNIDKDFPKFDTDDRESWIEIEYSLEEYENENLKVEYRNDDNTLRVRKYLNSEEIDVKTNQSNIYAYENGILSRNLFYGAKNIAQSKLGELIYIPDVSKSSEVLKLTGPSPFRNLLSYVMKKIMKSSPAYKELACSFDTFNNEFKREVTDEGISLNTLVQDINSNINTWGINFGIQINAIKEEEIIKSLMSHYIEDINLNNTIDIDNCGQGVQRHLIYTLILLSAKYQDDSIKKTDFNPNLKLILFEEPEVFLHPSQQERLNISLRGLGAEENNQILITTHSNIFVSQNTEDLKNICKVKKSNGISEIYQMNESDLKDLYDDNISIFKYFKEILEQSSDNKLKAEIRKRNLANEHSNIDDILDKESMKYFLWLDSERTSMFFVNHVILCEGPSEKIFFEYLINTKWTELKERNICIIDCMGKFNINRYMNLFSKLAISHSVLIDSDGSKGIQGIFNKFIDKSKNEFTKNVHLFETDIEDFLKIDTPKRKDLKPLNIMHNYKNNYISDEKITEIRSLLEELM
ncbi:ATP-dependent nuclease [Clostridium chauvoei]|uniref:ATP-dependent nuclease n=1 Tax=Clostridium chauvoei TaxID=46867 RepID=UPI000BB8F4DD|nr:AAA family ATPase [Clostridium chauvoei]ATD58450.1 ATP-dependent endonuclease [Clostridium chauvoei]MBX7379821.1 AAA family ATPase [Clostridium chauvoei]MBX7384893.1 AAA family ATPase [Clostridium chauvoei]MBX7397483.1 AAA family ATPase [Clostridium chauvoei]MBX7399998.1 AAA family ATPase [Clostridium chauvoei]